MDLLSLMHADGRRGTLCGSVAQLAQATRCRPAVFVQALADLQATGTATVTKRNNDVTVINRRMKREHKDREATRLRVRKFRGNASVTEMCALESESESEYRDQKRLNDAKNGHDPADKPEANGQAVNRSSLNRSQEAELMGRLREILGPDEMARAGGHWRVDHVRKHPGLVARVLDEYQRAQREGQAIGNPGAYCEDLVKRWK